MPYLIDGHNLIGKLPGLSLSDPADELKLAARLQAFAQRVRQTVTVVFDPGTTYVAQRRQTAGEVRVIYARPGDSADRVIVSLARQERQKARLTVVTSDRAVIGQVRAEGVAVITSEAFVALMQPPAAAVDEDEEAERANVRISSDEVDSWMKEFKEARRRQLESQPKKDKKSRQSRK
jgi:predicted RNA-binding protein with PIN domain